MSKTMATLIQLQSLDQAVAGGTVDVTPYRKRKRRNLIRMIPEAIARDYDRVRIRHTNAVVAVEDRICQGCFVQLPPAILEKLKDPRARVCCDHCGRILYLPVKPRD